MINTHSICAFKDNYIWAIVENTLNQAIIVDPGDASPALDFLHKNNLELAAILITHKHADHSGGICELLSHYPNAPVFAHETENISGVTNHISAQDKIHLENFSCDFTVIEIPGHTLGHVAFYSAPYLFCGDTLFGAGCGRVFEGTPEQMLASLKKLSSLPDDTFVYCGHEYTVANLKFSLHVEPDNNDVQKRLKIAETDRSHNKPTVPSTMQLEKKTNPFLRCESKTIIENVEAHCQKKLLTEADVFRELREWKNNF